jgi:hypothetical protein
MKSEINKERPRLINASLNQTQKQRPPTRSSARSLHKDKLTRDIYINKFKIGKTIGTDYNINEDSELKPTK